MHKVYTNVMKKVLKDVALQFDLKTCSCGTGFLLCVRGVYTRKFYCFPN